MARLLAAEQDRVTVEKHVVSGLIAKRARVAGELSDVQMRVIRLKSDLAAIDCCIRMFKADFDPKTIAPKVTRGKSPAGLAKGIGTRTALQILRTSGDALNSEELARRVLTLLNKDTDLKSVTMLQKTIHSSFSRQKRPVVTLDRSTWPGKWRLLPL